MVLGMVFAVFWMSIFCIFIGLKKQIMKKLAILNLMIMVGTATFAQQAPVVTPPGTPVTPVSTATVNPNAAEITFESETHDFGTFKKGGDGTYDFKFTNTGKEPLIISNARGSCGCTVPNWPKEPIKPGETGVIKVTYDTKRVGAFTKTVTITSNAKTQDKVITIKGKVEDVPAEDVFPGTQKNGTPFDIK